MPGTGTTLPAEPLEQRQWDSLFQGARGERLIGLAASAIADGAMAVTPEQTDQVRRAHIAVTGKVLVLEGLLLEVVGLLERADVDYRVLKGPSLAHLDYPEPSLRSFADVDLIVPVTRFDDVTALLAAAGCVRTLPELRPGFDRRFGKAVTFVTASGTGIDLHRTLDRGPFGLTVRLSDLWSGSSTFWLRGQALRALEPETRFLSVCYHAALGNLPPRLTPLRDVAQMLANGRLDAERVCSLARAWRGEIVVARAVRLASERFRLEGEDPLSVWARRYRPGLLDRHTLAVYLDPDRSQAAGALHRLRFIPGVRDRLAYVSALAFPTRGYLGERKYGYVARWRRSLLPWREVKPASIQEEAPPETSVT